MRKCLFPRAQRVFRHCTVKHMKKAIWAVSQFDLFTKGKAENPTTQNWQYSHLRAWEDKLPLTRIDLNSQLRYEFRKPLLRVMVLWQSLSLPSSSHKNAQHCKGNSVASFSCLLSPPVHESNHKQHIEAKVCRQGSQSKGQLQTARCQHGVFLLNMAIILNLALQTSLFPRDSKILNSPVQPSSLVIPLPKLLIPVKPGLTA